MIKFHVISIFPEMVEAYTNESILKRASKKKLASFKFYNLRDYTKDKHKKVDDKPYGGGPGMVMNVEPIVTCVDKIKSKIKNKKKIKVVLFKPFAPKFNNSMATNFSKKYSDIILICGRYEGIDKRVEDILKPEIISIGDFVLTGGEIPAMVIIDSVVRQIKGVLGNAESIEESRDSHDEFFTKPSIFKHKKKNYSVPKEFLSGDPKQIAKWKEGRRNVKI